MKMKLIQTPLTALTCIAGWLVIVVLGLLNIYYAQELFLILAVAFDFTAQASLGNWVALAMGLAVVGVTIGSAEYLWKNWATAQSWRLLLLTLGLELLIPLAVFVA